MSDDTPNPVGRPPHQPPDWTPKQWVMRMSWYGMPNKRIAELMEISETTLVKHYGPELEEGRSYRIVRLANVAYERAMDKEDKDSAKMLTLCLTTRGGWSSTQKTEVSGPEGGPQVHKFVDGPPQENYEQWAARRARITAQAGTPLPTKLGENDPDD